MASRAPRGGTDRPGRRNHRAQEPTGPAASAAATGARAAGPGRRRGRARRKSGARRG